MLNSGGDFTQREAATDRGFKVSSQQVIDLTHYKEKLDQILCLRPLAKIEGLEATPPVYELTWIKPTDRRLTQGSVENYS